MINNLIFLAGFLLFVDECSCFILDRQEAYLYVLVHMMEIILIHTSFFFCHI